MSVFTCLLLFLRLLFRCFRFSLRCCLVALKLSFTMMSLLWTYLRRKHQGVKRKDVIEGLKVDIANLTHVVEAGKTASLVTAALIRELMEHKDDLVQKHDAQVDTIIALRSEMTELHDKLKWLEAKQQALQGDGMALKEHVNPQKTTKAKKEVPHSAENPFHQSLRSELEDRESSGGDLGSASVPSPLSLEALSPPTSISGGSVVQEGGDHSEGGLSPSPLSSPLSMKDLSPLDVRKMTSPYQMSVMSRRNRVFDAVVGIRNRTCKEACIRQLAREFEEEVDPVVHPVRLPGGGLSFQPVQPPSTQLGQPASPPPEQTYLTFFLTPSHTRVLPVSPTPPRLEVTPEVQWAMVHQGALWGQAAPNTLGAVWDYQGALLGHYAQNVVYLPLGGQWGPI